MQASTARARFIVSFPIFLYDNMVTNAPALCRERSRDELIFGKLQLCCLAAWRRGVLIDAGEKPSGSGPSSRLRPDRFLGFNQTPRRTSRVQVFHGNRGC